MTLLITDRPHETCYDVAEIAARAHAILAQTLPDEVLDEFAATDPTLGLPFRFPTFLVG